MEAEIHAATAEEWREWLRRNSETSGPVWLVIGRQGSVGYRAAVEEALCVGWVDSKAIKHDPESTHQRFSKRNPKSTWSKVNRERVGRLIAEGRMAEPGLAMIELAKRTGTWDALADAQDLIVPDDLRQALTANPTADTHFQAFPPSSRRRILEWISTAKKSDTRQRRIVQTVELAERNIRANHPPVRKPVVAANP